MHTYVSMTPVSNTDPSGYIVLPAAFVIAAFSFVALVVVVAIVVVVVAALVIREMHYNRNKKNTGIPGTETEMIELVETGEWKKLPPEESVWHIFSDNSNDPCSNIENTKYVSQDGHCMIWSEKNSINKRIPIRMVSSRVLKSYIEITCKNGANKRIFVMYFTNKQRIKIIDEIKYRVNQSGNRIKFKDTLDIVDRFSSSGIAL